MAERRKIDYHQAGKGGARPRTAVQSVASSPRDLFVFDAERPGASYAVVMTNNQESSLDVYKNENGVDGVRGRRGSDQRPFDMPVRVNMAVRTEQQEQKGISYAGAVRKLQAITKETHRLTRIEIMAEIQGLITAIGESLPPVIQPPPMARLHARQADVEREHGLLVRRVYLFILTGNVNRLSAQQTPTFAMLRFIDTPISTPTAVSELVAFLIHATQRALFWNSRLKLMVLVKLVFSKQPSVSRQSIVAFPKICDTPSQLFLFVELSQDYIDREGLRGHKELTRDEMLLKRLNWLNITATGQPPGDAPTSSKLRLHAKQLKCVRAFYEDTEKCSDLLLYFLLNHKSGRSCGVDHVHLLRLSHPKFQGDKRKAELNNVIVAYILHKMKGFQRKVGSFIQSYPFVMGLENRVMNAILMISELTSLTPKRAGDVDKLLDYWREDGKRLDTVKISGAFGSGKSTFLGQYTESIEEYANIELLGYRLTIEQIPKPFLGVEKVWVEIVEDIPYLVLLDKLPSIFKMKNKMLHKIEIAMKFVEVIKNRERLLLSKAHPVILIKHYHLLKNVSKKLHHSQRHINHNLIIESLYDTFHDCLACPNFKTQHATHKRCCFGLDVPRVMFSDDECLPDGAIPPMDAALSMLMCYSSYEEYFNVFVLPDHLERVSYVTELFRSGLKLWELKKELRKYWGNESVMQTHKLIEDSLSMNLDVDIFVVFSENQLNNTENEQHHITSLVLYKEAMHRPFTKAITWDFNTRCKFLSFSFMDDSIFNVFGFDENIPKFIARISKLGDVIDGNTIP